MKYLSLDGLSTFWKKVKAYIDAIGTRVTTVEGKVETLENKELKLEDITDVTAKVEEVNYLSGVKSNVQAQLDTKAPLASPDLTGTPTAPTATPGTNTTQIATTAFVKDAVDTAVGGVDLTTLFDDVEYNKTDKKIYFKHGTSTLKSIDATDFIKDGMVDTVGVADGTGDNIGKKVLKLTFNTEAGKDAIEVPLEGIFKPEDYYLKTEVDAKLEDYVLESDLIALTDEEVESVFDED